MAGDLARQAGQADYGEAQPAHRFDLSERSGVLKRTGETGELPQVSSGGLSWAELPPSWVLTALTNREFSTTNIRLYGVNTAFTVGTNFNSIFMRGIDSQQQIIQI